MLRKESFVEFVLKGQRSEESGNSIRWIPLEFHRDQPAKETNRIRVIASTCNVVNMGRYREVLKHSPEAIDYRSACTVLFNHNKNFPIGGIREIKIDNAQMVAELEIDPEARAESGIKILDAVRRGDIRGVSVGYHYDFERDATITEDSDGNATVTANRWQLREISLTPTQADIAAQTCRQLPECLKRTAAPNAVKEENAMTEQEKLRFKSAARAAGLSDVEINGILGRCSTYLLARDAMDEVLESRANQTANERAIKAAKEAQVQSDREIFTLARSHGLEKPENYIGKSLQDASVEMLRDLADEKMRAGKNTPKGTSAVGADVTVGVEAIEKKRELAVGSLLHMGGIKDAKTQTENPYMGRGIKDIIRSWAMLHNEPGVHEWNSRELALYALGQGSRSANVTSGAFATYVLVNAMDKAVMLGFTGFMNSVTYPLWTRTRMVADFKTVTGAALDQGNLVKTIEDAPFPELNKAEAGYTSALGMWGVTISLTIQAIINDDLGEFMSQLNRAGAIAQRTIDKEVIAQMVAATWTNNVTASAGLASAGTNTPFNLDLTRADFVKKVGPGGEIMGNVPRFLLHNPALAYAADVACGRIVPGGLLNLPSVRNASLQPIETPYAFTNATDYFLLADPALADTCVILKLNGMENPVIEEYDAGAVAAKKWKLYLPFTAKPILFTSPQTSTTIYAPGMQKATA